MSSINHLHYMMMSRKCSRECLSCREELDRVLLRLADIVGQVIGENERDEIHSLATAYRYQKALRTLTSYLKDPLTQDMGKMLMPLEEALILLHRYTACFVAYAEETHERLYSVVAGIEDPVTGVLAKTFLGFIRDLERCIDECIEGKRRVQECRRQLVQEGAYGESQFVSANESPLFETQQAVTDTVDRDRNRDEDKKERMIVRQMRVLRSLGRSRA